MPYSEYAWEIEPHAGAAFRGEDRMPAPSEREAAHIMRLALPASSVVFKVAIPPGGKLIFLRRNKIDLHEDGTETRTFHYLFGFKGATGKVVHAIEPLEDGWLATALETDGRND